MSILPFARNGGTPGMPSGRPICPACSDAEKRTGRRTVSPAQMNSTAAPLLSVRLFEASAASLPWFSNVPAAFVSEAQWRVAPLYQLFGSEEMSQRSPVFQQFQPGAQANGICERGAPGWLFPSIEKANIVS